MSFFGVFWFKFSVSFWVFLAVFVSFSLSLKTTKQKKRKNNKLTRHDQRRGPQHPPRHRLLQHQPREDDVRDELHAAQGGEQRLRGKAERHKVEDVSSREEGDPGLPLPEGAGGARLAIAIAAGAVVVVVVRRVVAAPEVLGGGVLFERRRGRRGQGRRRGGRGVVPLELLEGQRLVVAELHQVRAEVDEDLAELWRGVGWGELGGGRGREEVS